MHIAGTAESNRTFSDGKTARPVRAQKSHATFHPIACRFHLNLHLTKTRPILAISEKSLIFALFTHKDDFLLHGKPDILQFPTGASLARPPSFPTGQLTFGRLAAGDYGHDIGNALFSSSVRIVFPAWRFLSPAAQGQTYGIILSLPFSIRLSPSQNHGLCVCGQNTRILTVPTCYIGL